MRRQCHGARSVGSRVGESNGVERLECAVLLEGERRREPTRGGVGGRKRWRRAQPRGKAEAEGGGGAGAGGGGGRREASAAAISPGGGGAGGRAGRSRTAGRRAARAG